MDEGSPSRTAYGVALSRAAHQIFDSPRVFDDPVALTLIGTKAAGDVREAGRRFAGRFQRALRALVVARSRVAEDALAEAVARGVRQYVVLGAGLDTFAYRNPHAALGLRVFEVDHPMTQEWKRQLISRAHLASPQWLTYVPMNFETQLLGERLAANGFQVHEPAFFSWLGVTMYLTPPAIRETLRFVAQTGVSRSGMVFDYLTLPPRHALLRRWLLRALMRRLEVAGEPWRTFFDPRQLHRELMALGFATVRDFSAEELNARFFAGPGTRLRIRGPGRVVLARK